jgi:hypothetical protein
LPAVKRPLTAALAAACLCAVVFAVPALGGPTISTVAKKAARALKLARGADTRSKKALALSQRTAARIAPGTNGTSGTPGSTGGSGATGPAGPAGPAGPNGTSGSPGSAGSTGPAGPQGPPGPSGAQRIDFRAAAGTGATKIFDFGGLVLTASCDPGPNLSVSASSTVANSELHISGDRILPGGGTTVTPVYLDNDHLGPASPPVSFPPGNFQGTFSYSTPAGVVVTGTVAAEQTAFNGQTDCWFGGWALHNPA